MIKYLLCKVFIKLYEPHTKKYIQYVNYYIPKKGYTNNWIVTGSSNKTSVSWTQDILTANHFLTSYYKDNPFWWTVPQNDVLFGLDDGRLNMILTVEVQEIQFL